MTFTPFSKIARLSRDMIVTEKLDGTNASVVIEYASIAPETSRIATVGDYAIFAGSRTRFITPQDDNFGFATWVKKNAEELTKLGTGVHFGEWWGVGIQRGYDLSERRFSLFNTSRWKDENLPACCSVVPVLAIHTFSTELVGTLVERLRTLGSVAAPGYMKPEGVVVFHAASGTLFKKTLEADEKPKGSKEVA